MSHPVRAIWALVVGCVSTLAGCHHSTVDSESVQNGAQIFGTVCARCHGTDGKGGIAAGATNAPRNFCDAAFQASRSDDDLMQTIQKGKGAMPAFGNMFSDTDLRGLVHALRSFDPSGLAQHVDSRKGQ